MHRTTVFKTLLILAAMTLAPLTATAEPDAGPAAADKDAGGDAKADDKKGDAKKDAEGAEKKPAYKPMPPELAARADRIPLLLKAKKYKDALVILDDILTFDPANEVAMLYKIEALGATVGDEKTLEWIEGVVKGPHATGRIYIKQASLQERLKAPKKARDILDAATVRFPKDPGVWIRRGQTRTRSEPQGAIDDYKRALTLAPTNRTALNNLASIHMARMEWGAARTLLETYRKHHPSSNSGAFNLGTVYYALGEADKGIAIFDELGGQRGQESFVVSQLALGHVLAGNPDKAMETLKKMLEAPDPSPVLTYTAGMAMLEKRDVKAADAWLAKAIAKAPRRTHFVAARAEVLRLQSKYDEANALLEKHNKLTDTARPYVFGYQALVLHSQGKADEARAKLKQALDLMPDAKDPASMRYQLRMTSQAREDAQKIAAPAAEKAAPKADAGAPAPKKEGGCGCVTTAPTRNNGGAALLLLGLLAVFVRRRG